jgi:PQ loop repeat
LKAWSLRTCTIAFALVASACAGVQAALIEGVGRSVGRTSAGVTTMAVLSAGLLAAGVLRHYWDIYQHRTVRGISFVFVGIDAAGDLFSLVSVCEFSSPLLVICACVFVGELTGDGW